MNLQILKLVSCIWLKVFDLFDTLYLITQKIVTCSLLVFNHIFFTQLVTNKHEPRLRCF